MQYIVFSWVKAHVGITGDELADRIAKAAVRDKETTNTYNRIHKSTIYRELEDQTINKMAKNVGGKLKCRPDQTVLPKRF
jgi:hypothetical protein